MMFCRFGKHTFRVQCDKGRAGVVGPMPGFTLKLAAHTLLACGKKTVKRFDNLPFYPHNANIRQPQSDRQTSAGRQETLWSTLCHHTVASS
jgi:hypothetical protein